MELSNDWHKRTNVRLADILSDILKEMRPQKVPKPTHGYRIAEKAPEIVTAPGAYFPEKKGRVIPLESRQAGGPVTPAPTRTLQQMLEKLASYAPFPISGAATQSTTARQRVEGQGENRLETAIESKPLPLVPRQMGGEVDPNLFKEKFSVNFGDPTQQGIEAAANTASLKDTPLNVSPPTPSLQSFAPGANSTPTGPSAPLTGMAAYEAAGRRMRGLPEPLGTTAPTGQGDSINNPMEQRLNSISRSLGLMIKPPPEFKYRGSRKGLESSQREEYNKKNKPYQDLMSSLNPAPLFSRAGGGSTSPDPFEGLSEEERAKLLKLQGGHGNIVDMAPNASGTFEARSAPVMTKTLNAGETTIPKTEPAKQIEGGAPRSLSEISKDILPSGETRYTLPGTEGTATVESPATYLKRVGGPEGAAKADKIVSDRWATEAASTPEGMELAERKKWAAPGYGEAQKAKRQKESDLERTERGLPMSKVIGVSPGYEKTYYEAHPEERFMDMATEANRPLMDAYMKMIEQSQNIIKGNFGDVTMGRRAKREARNAAIAGLPHLEQGLAQLMASNAAMPGKVGAPPGMGKTPTLHTDEDKYSMTLYNQPYRELDESKRKIVDTKVTELKPSAEKSPYKIGQRQKFIGKDGQEYEGTFLGLDANNEPNWGSPVKISEKATAEKVGQNWMLPDGSSAISYDGGRTYIVPDGQTRPMPSTAVKVPGGATLGEIKMEQAREQARLEMGGGKQEPSKPSPKEAALGGTGPYGRIASTFEAVAGGLGLDLLVGEKEGFFPNLADAKQYLRSVKQMGKAALMNSSRGAIWEQQKIDQLFPDPDKTFTNPRIEARKFGNLLEVLSIEKMFNNQAIVDALTPQEIGKYRSSNNEIDRLISFISEPQGSGLTDKERALVEKYLIK